MRAEFYSPLNHDRTAVMFLLEAIGVWVAVVLVTGVIGAVLKINARS
jgi:hypothetical protein